MGILTQTHNGLNFLGTEAHIQADGSTKMTIKSDGKVGIGTASPTAKLQVGGGTSNSGSTTAMFSSNSDGILNALSLVNTSGGSNGRGVRLSFHNQSSWSATGAIQTIQTSGTHAALAFMTYGGSLTEKMRITSDGNVGIGVTNPDRRLKVNGRVAFYEYSGSWATNIAHSNFQVATLINNSAGTSGSSIGSYMKISAAATGATGTFSDFRSRAYAENTTVNTDWLVNYLAEYRNYTSTSSVTLGNHAGLWVKPLGVAGSATVTNNYGVYLDIGTNATNNYGIYQIGSNVENYFQGKVGIGTTSPNQILDISGTQAKIRTSGGGWYIYNTSDGFRAALYDNGTYTGIFGDGTGSSPYIALNSGNVGIGTTGPSYPLQIDSDHTAVGLKIRQHTNNGYAPASILLEATSANSRGQGMFHYNTQSNKAWFTGVGYNNNSDKWFVGYEANTSFDPRVASSTYAKMTITSSGNVGIGTTSPTEKLHIQANTNGINKVLIQNDSDGSGAYAALGFQSDFNHTHHPGIHLTGTGNTSYAGANSLNLYQFHSKPIGFVTNNLLRAIITGGGNVGIGTTNPTAKLDIGPGSSGADTVVMVGGTGNGNLKARHIEGKLHNSTASDILHLNYYADDDVSIVAGGGNVMIGAGTAIAKLDVAGDTRSTNFQVNSGGRYKIGNANQYITGTNDTAIDIVTGGSTSLRVAHSGNVGIGTTSPYTKLDIRPDTITGLTLPTFGQSAHSGLHIVPSGTATTEAWYGITFGNTAGGTSERERTTAGIFTSAHGSYGNKLYFATSNSWATGAVSRMMIDHNGNVGIGTTSPAEKLHIQGSFTNNTFKVKPNSDHTIISSDQEFRISTTNSADIFIAPNGLKKAVFKATGNVGIGTTSPTQRLDVRGAALIAVDSPANPYGGSLEVYRNATRASIVIHQENASSQARLHLRRGTNDTYIQTDSNGFEIRTDSLLSGDPALRIANGGDTKIFQKLAVGNLNPSEKLHVAGNIKATGWIGRDSSNYITFDETNNHIDFYAGGNWVARMEADGDLHVKGDVIAFSNIFNP
jgi:hypothetical protein